MLQHAFDLVRFGPERTLNLRASFPTQAEAVRRADAWLRERQASNAGEVLLITGRGLGSPDGVSVVRAGICRLLSSLRRSGVVAAYREHTAGSFSVELAPLRALLEAPRRRRRQAPAPAEPTPSGVVEGLRPHTRALLELLATRTLDSLGAGGLGPEFVSAEMRRQFALLASAIPGGPQRERRLAAAIENALREFEN